MQLIHPIPRAPYPPYTQHSYLFEKILFAKSCVLWQNERAVRRHQNYLWETGAAPIVPRHSLNVARLSSTVHGTVRAFSAWIGSAALGCARLRSAWPGSEQLRPSWLGSARLGFILMAELRCQMFGWKSRIFGGPNDAPPGSSARELALSSEAPRLDFRSYRRPVGPGCATGHLSLA